MRPAITVVGLGPAGDDLIGPGTLERIAGADAAFLRTSRHPAAAALGDVATFDHHYEEADGFEDVYERIVADLVRAAEAVAADGGSVVYAVPGSPLVAERTVELLRADPRVDVSVQPALSFLDLAWERLGVDPLAAGVRLVDGTRFAEEAAGERGPLLVAQCWSAGVLSDMKLAVPDEAADVAVTVLHHLGLPDEVVAAVPWHELDRAVDPDHLTSVWVPAFSPPVAVELARLGELVRRLRRDCPWDRQQTHASLRRHLLEEAYEVIDAIEALPPASGASGSPPPGSDEEAAAVAHLEEELGDLLFQVFFHARLAEEESFFTMADVAAGLHSKLVARHPHVFGDVEAGDAATVVANWEEIKKAEKGRESVTEGIPAALPALALAAKLQRKAAAVPGVDAPSLADRREAAIALLGSLHDPTTAGALASRRGDGAGSSPGGASSELLWAVTDLVRRAGVEPEDALRAAARQFADEIRAAEASAREPEPGLTEIEGSTG